MNFDGFPGKKQVVPQETKPSREQRLNTLSVDRQQNKEKRLELMKSIDRINGELEREKDPSKIQALIDFRNKADSDILRLNAEDEESRKQEGLI